MTLPPADDALAPLMERYQQGAPAAFEELYRWLAPVLRGFLLGAKVDATRGEDLVQETFLRMHDSRRTYLPGEPVAPWALAISRYVLQRRSRLANGRSSDQRAANVELPEIPTCAQEALRLHQVCDLGFREIAAVQGTTARTAQARVQRAMSVPAESREPAGETRV